MATQEFGDYPQQLQQTVGVGILLLEGLGAYQRTTPQTPMREA